MEVLPEVLKMPTLESLTPEMSPELLRSSMENVPKSAFLEGFIAGESDVEEFDAGKCNAGEPE